MVSRVLFIPSTSWGNPLHLLNITVGFAVLDVHSLLTTNFTTFYLHFFFFFFFFFFQFIYIFFFFFFF